MKRILLLLVLLNSFSIAFCQSEIIEEKKDAFKPVSGMKISLEEVVLTGFGSKKTVCLNRCCAFMHTVMYTDFSSKKEAQLVLYPNPSPNGFFNLKIKENYSSVQVEVSSITGQRIFTKTFQNITSKISLNLSKYPSGIYLVNFIADGKRLPTKKVIRG